mmetsp:Transcript_65721/g.186577  ORF Transcript_65721/g.186577 Transcript_65721/m.186577 type:complete len:228 (-) Transcript_65721:561-1244(-)
MYMRIVHGGKHRLHLPRCNLLFSIHAAARNHTRGPRPCADDAALLPPGPQPERPADVHLHRCPAVHIPHVHHGLRAAGRLRPPPADGLPGEGGALQGGQGRSGGAREERLDPAGAAALMPAQRAAQPAGRGGAGVRRAPGAAVGWPQAQHGGAEGPARAGGQGQHHGRGRSPRRSPGGGQTAAQCEGLGAPVGGGEAGSGQAADLLHLHAPAGGPHHGDPGPAWEHP